MSEIYSINNLDQFVEATRVLVYDAFGKTNNHDPDNLSMTLADLNSEEQLEIDTVLTQQESMLIAQDFIRVRKKHNRVIYTISEKKYMAMIESFNDRLISNMLRNLTQMGLLDSAYDSEINDFIFWIKDDENKDKDSKTG